MNIAELGWDLSFEANFESWRARGMVPARVVAEAGPSFEVECEHGTLLTETSGKLKHTHYPDMTVIVVPDNVLFEGGAGREGRSPSSA